MAAEQCPLDIAPPDPDVFPAALGAAHHTAASEAVCLGQTEAEQPNGACRLGPAAVFGRAHRFTCKVCSLFCANYGCLESGSKTEVRARELGYSVLFISTDSLLFLKTSL